MIKAFDSRCLSCAETREIFVHYGEHPPCVRCGGATEYVYSTHTVIGDEYPGGKTFEHLDHEPVTVYSKSELQREMDKRHLRFTDRYHRNDGPDWRLGIDAKTLDNARVLVSRGQKATDDPGKLLTFKGTLRDIGPGEL